MPTKAIEKITSWSFSRWETYRECPLKAKLKFIDKKKEPGSLAMDEGTRIHGLAERYIIDRKSKLPPELKLFRKEFADLRKRPVAAEFTLAFKDDWSPTTFDDWGGCRVRIKVDAMYVEDSVVTLIDYKTGKAREVSKEQMELYALGALLSVPEASEARTNLWYLNKGVIYGADGEEGQAASIYQRPQLPTLIKTWEARVKPMLNDTRFAPRPGPYCSWCHFRKANGGPCKY
jgi:RecB family exonuclease